MAQTNARSSTDKHQTFAYKQARYDLYVNNIFCLLQVDCTVNVLWNRQKKQIVPISKLDAIL